MKQGHYPVPTRPRSAGERLRSAEFGLGVGQCRIRQDPCAVAARHPAAARRHRPVEDPLPDLYARRGREHVEPRVLDPVGMDDAGRRGAWPKGSRQWKAARPSADKLRRARKLFAEALETPGGLKIQTIHAFCESVLHQFPLEANIAAHFEMLDPQMEEALFGEARREMLTGRGRRRSRSLPRPSPRCWSAAASMGWTLLLPEIVRKRDGLRAFIDALAGDAAPFADAVRRVRFRARRDGGGDRRFGLAAAGLSPGVLRRHLRQAAEAADARERAEQHAAATLAGPSPRPIRCGG